MAKQEEENAAIKIQSIVRGNQERKRYEIERERERERERVRKEEEKREILKEREEKG